MANLTELLQTHPELKTILATTEATGWDVTLKGPAWFTLFAPTDTAFASLPPGVVANLFRFGNMLQLNHFLTYHLTTGKLLPSDITSRPQITTISGDTLVVAHPTEASYVMLNGVVFGQTFSEASNGVLYILNNILLPV